MEFKFSQNVLEDLHDFSYWLADEQKGLIRLLDPWNPNIETIRPNSPSSADVFDLELVNGELWSASGGLGILNAGDLLNHRTTDGSWVEFDNNFLAGKTDIVKVKVDPTNSNRVYASSWQQGLFEIVNGQVTNNYIAQNSVLDSVFYGITAVGTIDFDTDNNMWVTCSFTNGVLAVKTPTNDWYSYSFLGLTSPSDFYVDFLIDQNNYKWFGAQEEHKIFVFDDGGTLDNTSDDRIKTLTSFPGSKLYAMVQDKDGEG